MGYGRKKYVAPLSASLRIEGLRSLDAALRALPAAVQREVLEPALEEGGEIIRRGIEERIRGRTGKTARDLRVVVQVQTSGPLTDVGGVAAIGAGPPRAKTSRTFVLRFLEFGTKAHRIERALSFGGKVFSRVQHPGIAPQAPMTRALAEDGRAAVQAFIDGAWERIRVIARRLADRRSTG